MREVVYHTKYFDPSGTSLKVEEYTACFSTPLKEGTYHQPLKAISAKQLHPTKETTPLTIEQLDQLKALKSDHTLLSAVLSPGDDGYIIDAMYEKQLQQ